MESPPPPPAPPYLGHWQMVSLGDMPYLSPVLFHIHMKLPGEVIGTFGLWCAQLYADDTQLLVALTLVSQGTVETLSQWCLGEVMGLMKRAATKLKFSPDKTDLVGGTNLSLGNGMIPMLDAGWPLLEEECFVMVIPDLITSRLHCCNTLYVGLPLKMVWKLSIHNPTSI